MEPIKWQTPQEVARALDLNVKTIYRRVERGAIPPFQVKREGHYLYISSEYAFMARVAPQSLATVLDEVHKPLLKKIIAQEKILYHQGRRANKRIKKQMKMLEQREMKVTEREVEVTEREEELKRVIASLN